MKITIYTHKEGQTDYLVGFNDTEYKFLTSLENLHREAYKWMGKKSIGWIKRSTIDNGINNKFHLAATLYVTALKEIPTALEAYPELLL
jgi:hypothetical protein